MNIGGGLVLSRGDPVDGKWESMTSQERAARYRQFAAEALQQASEAVTDRAKAGHLDMAARWESLAQDIEWRAELGG